MSVEAVVRRVQEFPAAHVVLTGGEPMAAREIGELSARLREQGKHITIETAGTLPPQGIACDLASISPKLANSTPMSGTIADAWIERHEARRFQPGVIRQWTSAYPFQLKFVVEKAADLEDIRAVLAGVGGEIPPWKVLVMPQGINPEGMRAGEGVALEACKTHGYRFCSRLHIHLFGNTKGT